MGPADSEPLLVSLAAALEAINGWAIQQPDNWWDTRRQAEPERPADLTGPDSIADEVA
jgi:amidase